MSSRPRNGADASDEEPTLFDAKAVPAPQKPAAGDDEDDAAPTIQMEGKEREKHLTPEIRAVLERSVAGSGKHAAVKPPAEPTNHEMTMDSQQLAFDVLARGAFKPPPEPGKTPKITNPSVPRMPAPTSSAGKADSSGDFDSTQYLVTAPLASQSVRAAAAKDLGADGLPARVAPSSVVVAPEPPIVEPTVLAPTPKKRANALLFAVVAALVAVAVILFLLFSR